MAMKKRREAAYYITTLEKFTKKIMRKTRLITGDVASSRFTTTTTTTTTAAVSLRRSPSKCVLCSPSPLSLSSFLPSSLPSPFLSPYFPLSTTDTDTDGEEGARAIILLSWSSTLEGFKPYYTSRIGVQGASVTAVALGGWDRCTIVCPGTNYTLLVVKVLSETTQQMMGGFPLKKRASAATAGQGYFRMTENVGV